MGRGKGRELSNICQTTVSIEFNILNIIEGAEREELSELKSKIKSQLEYAGYKV